MLKSKFDDQTFFCAEKDCKTTATVKDKDVIQASIEIGRLGWKIMHGSRPYFGLTCPKCAAAFATADA